jgi:hypothetical protein
MYLSISNIGNVSCVCVPMQVLTCSGDSAEVDVFMNFGYKAFSLTLS